MPDLPPPLTGATTHADHGEDIIIKVVFDVMGVTHPSYLDVGAHDPWHINNTVALYAAGARGINVEPNPALIGKFNKYRAEDLNLCCAVGPERALSRPLYIDDNPGLSSFHRGHVDNLADTIDVETWTIPDILIGHRGGAWPDLLTIDIEGEDLAVIEACLPASGDRPTVVCVEYLRLIHDNSHEWRKLMPALDYFLYCRTRSNMLWVKNEAREALL